MPTKKTAIIPAEPEPPTAIIPAEPSALEHIFDTAGEESERYAVLRTFYEQAGIEQKTDLKNREINSVVITELLEDIISENFGFRPPLKDYTKNIKLHLVSRDRKGREEAMDVLKSETEKKVGLLQKLMGREE